MYGMMIFGSTVGLLMWSLTPHPYWVNHFTSVYFGE